MKKKVIGLTIAGVIALSGVVSAASMWGTYKGNDVIRLTVDGAPVKVTDVPAISYNNRTMIPINLLKQAGINYTWDGSNKTVDIAPQKSLVSKEEYRSTNGVLQENRSFIVFMDQIELADICIDLINYSQSQSDYNQAMQTVNRINIDGLDDSIYTLQAIGTNHSSSFRGILTSITSAKNYLLKGDIQNARSMVLAARSSMNVLHDQLDYDFNSIVGPINQKVNK